MNEPEHNGYDWRKEIGPPSPGNVFMWILVAFAAAMAVCTVSFFASFLWQHS